jgi:hypothetical protein
MSADAGLLERPSAGWRREDAGMRNRRTIARAWMISGVFAFGGCLDAEGEADEEVADDSDTDVELDEARSGCGYVYVPPVDCTSSIPPAPAPLGVGCTGHSIGGCDLFVFEAGVTPPGDVARLVRFYAETDVAPAEYDARVWKMSCTNQPCRAVTAQDVPMTVTVDEWSYNPFIATWIPTKWIVRGELTLPANNAYHTVWGGMRVLDVDDDPVDVWIDVLEDGV